MTTAELTRRDALRAGLAGATTLLVGGIMGCGRETDRVAAGAVASCPPPQPPRRDLTMTEERRNALTPAQAVALLKDGNGRFVGGSAYVRDAAHDRDATAGYQYPFAAILGCIDSRAPAEIVFDAGIGDVFDARVAGNIADPNLVGSLEFSCLVSGAKVVVVMGHTNCGAVKGACDNVKLGNLTGLLALISPAVAAVRDVPGERSSKNSAFVEAVAKENVHLCIKRIRAMSALLREAEAKGTVMIVGAMYDLASGKVEFYDT